MKSGRADSSVTGRLVQRFEQARSQLAALEVEIRETRERLAVYSEPGGPDEVHLAELLVRRKEQALELGLVIAGWTTLGGEARLTGLDQVASGPTSRGPRPLVVQRRRAVAADVSLPPPRRSEQPAPGAGVDVEVARQLLDDLGQPTRIETAQDYIQEIDHLSRSVDRLDRWLSFPPTFQRLFVAHCTARARSLQHEAAAVRPRVPGLPSPEDLFPVLSRFSKRHRPGFVWGLDRNHDPEGEDWYDDTLRHWHRLRGMVAEPGEVIPSRPGNPEQALLALEESLEEAEDDDDRVRDAVRNALQDGAHKDDPRLLRKVIPFLDLLDSSEFRSLRQAARKLQREDDEVEAEAKDDPIPADWELLSMTASQSGVIVGGDPREERRRVIEQALELESLDWVPTEHMRGIQALGHRIRSGSVGLVIVLARFVSHAIVEQLVSACKDADVPFVVVDRGYGLTQIRHAMEQRFLA